MFFVSWLQNSDFVRRWRSIKYNFKVYPDLKQQLWPNIVVLGLSLPENNKKETKMEILM